MNLFATSSVKAGPEVRVESSFTRGAATSSRNDSRKQVVYLFLGLLVFLTFAIGQRGLNEPDEGRYSEMALEMLEPQSSWLEPQTSDVHHYDKPPLIYWLTAICFRCFGKGEIAARLPSVFGAMLALAGLFWTASRLYGREVAWWSVLICGTLAQFWALARFLSPDMLLTGWCTLAIAAWAESRHRNAHRGFWFLSLFFWTLAWWTKATPTLVPLLGLIAAVFLMRDDAGKKALRPGRILLGILVLGSPWYLLMMHRHPELARFFFGHELVGRIAGDEHNRHKPIYFFFLTSWILWLPWLPLLAGFAFFKRRNLPKLNLPAIRHALKWDGWIVLIGLAIFSFNSSKLLTYTLPLAPWAALLLARILIHTKRFLPETSFRRIAFGAPIFFALLAISFVVAWPKVESSLGPNSSVRGVARFLRGKNAQVVFMDKYWPGMEFYFGENVYYVGKKPMSQVIGDTGFCPEIGDSHFCKTEDLPEKLQKFSGRDVWLVHFAPPKKSELPDFATELPVLERNLIGNFELLQIKQ